ncbi:MAG: HNH endonuclease [Gammaproteobacteria bacterium]|nr:MAG: HNH endonuclease [Gammaproteobacteria bacterium]
MYSTLKNKVVERAQGCCEYCRSQVRFATQSFSIEHIIPQSKGGQNTLDNLALACQGCNIHKYNKTEAIDPIMGEIVPLYNPRQQKWPVHFTWNEDFSIIIGMTTIGRVTVETLRLNRAGLVNLRRVLYMASEHPPPSNSF